MRKIQFCQTVEAGRHPCSLYTLGSPRFEAWQALAHTLGETCWQDAHRESTQIWLRDSLSRIGHSSARLEEKGVTSLARGRDPRNAEKASALATGAGHRISRVCAVQISVLGIDNGNSFCYTCSVMDNSVEDRSILLQLKQMLPHLPQQERKVGDYVLTHPHEVVGLSITRLAEMSGTSTTTVSRLCRRMGTGGYRQLRIALAREWGSARSLMYVDLQTDDTLASVAQKMFAANIQALRDTQGTLDLDVLQQVVDTILSAGRVDIYATGGAGIAARELHFKCLQLGINANAFLDWQMQVMSAAAVTPEDVGIGISHAGTQRQVADALKLANAGGARTIALTSYTGTPVAEAADIVLCTTSLAAATAHDSPTVRTAQLAVVDVIYEAMLLEGRDTAQGNMARVAKAISDHTAGLNSVL